MSGRGRGLGRRRASPSPRKKSPSPYSKHKRRKKDGGSRGRGSGSSTRPAEFVGPPFLDMQARQRLQEVAEEQARKTQQKHRKQKVQKGQHPKPKGRPKKTPAGEPMNWNYDEGVWEAPGERVGQQQLSSAGIVSAMQRTVTRGNKAPPRTQ